MYTGERGMLSIQGKGYVIYTGRTVIYTGRTVMCTGERGVLRIQEKPKPSCIQGKTKTPLSRETNNTTIS